MARDELQAAVDAAGEAGKLILQFYGGDYDVRNKGEDPSKGKLTGDALRSSDYDPVTSADEAADAHLKKALSDAFPQHGWLSEETVDSPERLSASSVWIVDPIDGTKEFLEGIPEFAVSIALVEDGEPTVAALYNPAADEMYTAIKGGGTFLNGQRVFCSELVDLSDASLIVSRSEKARGEVDAIEPFLGEVRPVGSVAYKLAVVAAGGADLNVSVQPKNEWDVCGGDLLVREAGGHMVDLDGEVRRYNQENPLIEGGLAAGNKHLTTAVLDVVRRTR
ncbi:MAG: 3'(2'),5'-bisphosphate nucleotidase CysQ [Gemmatimonadetes bacterium]|jgi:myo-inositol-1(or 4)-monophosphatase|nr:3'(2'),5'-bisphosphate nucleotidase CysQ [Gemmatimonadota bacterium]MBT7862848.1 3'(2'),5'-bisphosphate nucleotidase CysQ [Gemmatimonadota bacterium]